MNSPAADPRPTIRVELASPDAAADDAVIDSLTRIVNEAYATTEGTLWAKRIERISRRDFAATVARGEVGVAWAGRDDDPRPAGCIRLRRLDDDTFEFGVLAVAPDQRGAGVGDALVSWAEDSARQQGATTMELKLLEPIEGTHDFKVMLAEWYIRLGYERVGAHLAEDGWPEAADELAVPCRFAVFQKHLA